MKATGIVRRIDDLGRVVIPKEENTSDSRGRPIGNIHGPRGRDYPEKIFTDQ